MLHAMGMDLKSAWGQLGPVKYLMVAWAVMPPLATFVLAYYMKDIGPWLREHPQGIWVFAVAFAVLAGVALLPTYAQCFLGGYAFGFLVGFPAVVAGFAGGAVIGYEISRLIGSDRILVVINQNPKWKAVRDALVGERADGGGVSLLKQLGMVLLLRIPPNSPFALTNLVMAGTGVRRPVFIIGTMLGMAPRSAVFVMLGASFQGAIDGEAVSNAMPLWLKIAGIALTVIVALIVVAVAKRALKRVVDEHGSSIG